MSVYIYFQDEANEQLRVQRSYGENRNTTPYLHLSNTVSAFLLEMCVNDGNNGLGDTPNIVDLFMHNTSGVDVLRTALEEYTPSQLSMGERQFVTEIIENGERVDRLREQQTPEFDEDIAELMIDELAVLACEHHSTKVGMDSTRSMLSYAAFLRSGLLLSAAPVDIAFYKNFGVGSPGYEATNKARILTAASSVTLRRVRDSIQERILTGDAPANLASYINSLDGLLFEYDAYAAILGNPKIVGMGRFDEAPYVLPTTARKDMGINVPKNKKTDITVFSKRGNSNGGYDISRKEVSVKLNGQYVSKGQRITVGRSVIMPKRQPPEGRYVGDVCDEILQDNGITELQAIRMAFVNATVDQTVFLKFFPDTPMNELTATMLYAPAIKSQ